MKKTIEQVEPELEHLLSKPVHDLFRELNTPLPDGYRLRIALLDRNGRKKRSNASADNWSPESGRLEMWFEPVGGERAMDQANLPKDTPARPNVSFVKAPVRTPREGADPVADLVRALDRAESRPGWDFVALKWFRDEALPSEGFSWTSSDAVRQSVLRSAIEKRLVLTSKIPNPKAPQFPVTAIRVNRLLPEVKAILGQPGTSEMEFEPIAIQGENLSDTILRERR